MASFRVPRTNMGNAELYGIPRSRREEQIPIELFHRLALILFTKLIIFMRGIVLKKFSGVPRQIFQEGTFFKTERGSVFYQFIIRS